MASKNRHFSICSASGTGSISVPNTGIPARKARKDEGGQEAYGIGPAMAAKFGNSSYTTPPGKRDLYIRFYFFR